METDQFISVDENMIKYNLLNLKQLVFEVTDACNLRCKYCGYSDFYEGYDKREDSYFSIEKAKRIIDYLANLWRKNKSESLIQPISIGFYGGEPLLNVPFIKEIISYLENIENIGKKFFYTTTTNAMLLEKHMDYLAEKKFYLLISLDGDKKAHSYRIDAADNNSFDRVMKNIKLLQEKHPSYFKKYVNFNSVLHNRNSVESTFNFITNLFHKNPMIAPLNNSGVRKEKIEEFQKTYQNITSSLLSASNCEQLETSMFVDSPRVKELLKYLHRYTNNVYDDYNNLMFDDAQTKVYPTGTCAPFFKKMFITTNGKILQCEHIKHIFAVGQVYEDRVELNFEKIIQQHNKYIFRYEKQCLSCAAKSQCSLCIFQVDAINTPGSLCPNYRNTEKQLEYVKQNIDYLREHPSLYKKLMTEVILSN